MAAMRIWIAGYGGPPAAAIGAIPVWIATGDGSIADATEALIDAYGGPFGGATAVWIAGYGGPPPASIGAVPIFIGGYAGAGGSVTPPPVTSVWSAADAAAGGMTLSNGGLTVTGSGVAAWGAVRGSISQTTGKLYVEFKIGSNIAINDAAHQIQLGLASAGFNIGSYLGSSNYSFADVVNYGTLYVSAGFSGGSTPLATSLSVNDVLMAAIDFGAGKVWLGLNNTWSGGSPGGSGQMVNFTPATVGALFPAIALNGATGVVTLQATAASQKYAPPSGFGAWDSAAPVVTGHRYWRLNMTATAGAAYSMAEVQFRTTVGTPLLFSGGTASASSFYDSTTTADKATDNDVSTVWSSTTVLAKLSPNTWMYDYGVGKALSVVEITVQARGGYPNQTPTVFTPQWSDDGVNWTSMGQINTAPWTDDFQIQTFPVRTPAQAYLARTVGGNEGGNGANIATLIDGLVSDGVWAKLDALYILAQQNQSDALLNLVGTSYTATILTLERGSTFVAYRGMNGGQWLTNFNAATAVSPHFTQNSASFGLWDTVNQFGTLMFGNGVDSGLWPHFSDGDFYARVNDLTSTGTPSSVLSGLYVGDRASGSAIHPFLNGADLGSVSSTAGVPASGNFTIGSASNPTDVVSAAFIGASLGAAGQLALYNRLRTYMTAVGVP